MEKLQKRLKMGKRSVNGKQEYLQYIEQQESIVARAYDTPIPGYMTFNTIALRLWRSVPANEFDFSKFNEGDYCKSLEQREKAEYITSVLYPNDNSYVGKELRLRNIEIAQEVGLDNIFIFGARIEEVKQLIDSMKNTDPYKDIQKPLWNVIESIKSGIFGHDHHALLDSITNRNDFYLIAHDFYHQAKTQIKIDQIYQDKIAWAKMSFSNSNRSGKFSSDKTIHEYAKLIWKIIPIEVPQATANQQDRFKLQK